MCVPVHLCIGKQVRAKARTWRKNLFGSVLKFELHPPNYEGPLNGLKQENDIVRCAFLKYHCGSGVNERLEGAGQ